MRSKNARSASISNEKNAASATITTPYNKGRATLTRKGAQWPTSLTIRLQKNKGETASVKRFLLANGRIGFSASLDGDRKVVSGEIEGGLELGRPWGEKLPLNPESKDPLQVGVKRAADAIEIVVPPEMTRSNPELLAFEWN